MVRPRQPPSYPKQSQIIKSTTKPLKFIPGYRTAHHSPLVISSKSINFAVNSDTMGSTPSRKLVFAKFNSPKQVHTRNKQVKFKDVGKRDSCVQADFEPINLSLSSVFDGSDSVS